MVHNIKFWHPVLMTSGVGLLLSMGIASYTVDFGSSRLDPRAARRTLHGSVQLMGAGFMVAGYLCMFIGHERESPGADIHFAVGHRSIRRAHVFLGLITLLFLIVQCVVGIRKYVLLRWHGRRSCALHGLFGPLVYILAIVVVLLGAFSWWEAATGWERIFPYILLALFIALLSLVLYRVFAGPGKSRSTSAHQPLVFHDVPAMGEADGYDRF